MFRGSRLFRTLLELVEGRNVGLDVDLHLLWTIANVEGHGFEGWVGGEVVFGG